MVYFTLIVHKARNLAAKDHPSLVDQMRPGLLINKKKKKNQSTSDPFAQVYVNGKKIGTTSHVEENLNPIWEQVFSFYCPIRTVKARIKVLDYDSVSENDDIGAAWIELSREYHQEWVSLQDEYDGSGGLGEVQITLYPNRWQIWLDWFPATTTTTTTNASEEVKTEEPGVDDRGDGEPEILIQAETKNGTAKKK